jgi:hypothetical protein
MLLLKNFGYFKLNFHNVQYIYCFCSGITVGISLNVTKFPSYLDEIEFRRVFLNFFIITEDELFNSSNLSFFLELIGVKFEEVIESIVKGFSV